MLEELDSASEQLHVALERYLHVCSGIRGLCLQGTSPRNTLAEYAQRVDRELGLVESYDMTVQKAKLAIKTTRNYTFSIAPINCLPLEVLTHIFYMVHDYEDFRTNRVAFVCSHWRSVALSLPSLWSHIAYHPGFRKPFYPELAELAQLRILRSGKTSLHFYLSLLAESYNTTCYYDNSPQRLCEIIAPRMESLELDLSEKDWPYGNSALLRALFSNCTPGRFTKLVTIDPGQFSFIGTPGDERLYSSALEVHLPHETLEKALSPITVLDLTGLFLPWTSSAYHGLVDLRLSAAYYPGDSINNNIPESHLVRILKASPGLRILHLRLCTTRQVEGGSAVRRVRLNELEILQIGFGHNTGFFHIEHLLRWLEPGSKPLRLSIRHSDSKSDQELTIPETKAFFSRTNVTKLYAGALPRLSELLPLLPHLKVLVVSKQSHCVIPNLPAHSDPRTYPQLDACFFHDCSLPLDEFLTLVQRCRPKAITLFDNRFHRDDLSEKVKMVEVEKQLLGLCSDVRITRTRPSMAEHQDLLYNY